MTQTLASPIEPTTAFTRHVAIRTTIGELLRGTYVQENEQSPNYLLTVRQQKVYRLNLNAILVGKEQVGTMTLFFVDDGTGKIAVRSFEENGWWNHLAVGDALIIIGKVRAYNQERYISPEILKKTNPLWLKVRTLELPPQLQTEKLMESAPIEILKPSGSRPSTEHVIEAESVEEQLPEDPALPGEKIIRLIRELDNGQGVGIEEIIKKSTFSNAEQIIEKLIEGGEIFQNLPGKVKVL